MENKIIIEGNKLIDIFMGIQRRSDYGENNDGLSYVISIKYHSSWDWIMPVVQRIDHVYRNSEDLSNDAVNAYVILSRDKIFYSIDVIYSDVIRFIKAYYGK